MLHSEGAGEVEVCNIKHLKDGSVNLQLETAHTGKRIDAIDAAMYLKTSDNGIEEFLIWQHGIYH